MTLETDLRAALVSALRADATFAAVVGNSTGTVHVEGGDQPDQFLAGAAGVAYCRVLDSVALSAFEESAVTRFRFEVRIDLVDVRGANDALSKAKQGIANALRSYGSGVFALLSDAGSNRRGASGEWRQESVDVTPLDSLLDRDRPIIRAVVTCTIGHVVPLV